MSDIATTAGALGSAPGATVPPTGTQINATPNPTPNPAPVVPSTGSVFDDFWAGIGITPGSKLPHVATAFVICLVGARTIGVATIPAVIFSGAVAFVVWDRLSK